MRVASWSGIRSPDKVLGKIFIASSFILIPSMRIPHLIIVCTYIFYTWYERFMQINLSYHAFHKRNILIMLFTIDSLQVRFRQLPPYRGRQQSNSNSQWTPITKQDYKGGRNKIYFDGNMWKLQFFKNGRTFASLVFTQFLIWQSQTSLCNHQYPPSS